MKLLAWAFMFVGVYSQVPKLCASPKQWEGNILRLSKGTQLTPVFEQKAELRYDEINQRLRYTDISSLGLNNGLYDIIQLHQLGKEYRLDIISRRCNVSTITSPFRPLTIPSGAKFDEYATIGSASGKHMDIVNWSFLDGDNNITGTVTSSACIPVQYTEFTPPSTLTSTVFFDIQSGIRAGAFTPPMECSEN